MQSTFTFHGVVRFLILAGLSTSQKMSPVRNYMAQALNNPFLRTSPCGLYNYARVVDEYDLLFREDTGDGGAF